MWKHRIYIIKFVIKRYFGYFQVGSKCHWNVHVFLDIGLAISLRWIPMITSAWLRLKRRIYTCNSLYLSCQLSSRRLSPVMLASPSSEQECLFVWILDVSVLLLFLLFVCNRQNKTESSHFNVLSLICSKYKKLIYSFLD